MQALKRWERQPPLIPGFPPPPRLYGIHPSGVARYRFGFLDLLDHQTIITDQPQCRFESVVASD